jgi:NADH:ubiquinone oxidoreductase subunit
MSIGTRLMTFFAGTFVGSDEFGNRYYKDPRRSRNNREKRWVLYKGYPEASAVSADWHGWLHHRTQEPPARGTERFEWQTPHKLNATGTPEAYRPPGHALLIGDRPRATGDYEPWSPR